MWSYIHGGDLWVTDADVAEQEAFDAGGEQDVPQRRWIN